MSENEREVTQDDIWVKGIKTIVGHHKKSLLDYVDALEVKTPGANSAMGAVKAKIHNDLSQIQLSIGILFETHRAGGSIKPFSDSFNKVNRSSNINNRRPNDNHKLQRSNA